MKLHLARRSSPSAQLEPLCGAKLRNPVAAYLDEEAYKAIVESARSCRKCFGQDVQFLPGVRIWESAVAEGQEVTNEHA